MTSLLEMSDSSIGFGGFLLGVGGGYYLFQYVDFNFGSSVVVFQFLIILAFSLMYISFIRGGEHL